MIEQIGISVALGGVVGLFIALLMSNSYHNTERGILERFLDKLELKIVELDVEVGLYKLFDWKLYLVHKYTGNLYKIEQRHAFSDFYALTECYVDNIVHIERHLEKKIVSYSQIESEFFHGNKADCLKYIEEHKDKK